MTSETLAIIAILLNFVTLGVVALQTKWTRDALHANIEALKSNKKSLDEGLKLRQLQVLPRAGYFITAQNDLEKWRFDLEEITRKLREILSSGNHDALRQIANNGLKSPKGLIHTYLYKNSPEWLARIWITAAQYYWNVRSIEQYFLEKGKPNVTLVQSSLNRYEESIFAIRVLQGYISDLIPKVYLESPAKLDDKDFLGT